MFKRALITGITGQDGSYLTELLLGKGYEVHGIIRRASSFNTGRIDHIYQEPHGPEAQINGRRLFLHYGDLASGEQLTHLIYNMQPDEIYHLGAQSHVRVSFDVPEFTGDITGLGTTRILEAVRNSGITCRFYQAGSSEMFEPRIRFHELVRIMVDADVEALGAPPKGAGRGILQEKFGDWHQWSGSVSRMLEAAAGTALGD